MITCVHYYSSFFSFIICHFTVFCSHDEVLLTFVRIDSFVYFIYYYLFWELLFHYTHAHLRTEKQNGRRST